MSSMNGQADWPDDTAYFADLTSYISKRTGLTAKQVQLAERTSRLYEAACYRGFGGPIMCGFESTDFDALNAKYPDISSLQRTTSCTRRTRTGSCSSQPRQTLPIARPSPFWRAKWPSPTLLASLRAKAKSKSSSSGQRRRGGTAQDHPAHLLPAIASQAHGRGGRSCGWSTTSRTSRPEVTPAHVPFGGDRENGV